MWEGVAGNEFLLNFDTEEADTRCGYCKNQLYIDSEAYRQIVRVDRMMSI